VRELRESALAALRVAQPAEKVLAVRALACARAAVDPDIDFPEPEGLPGRPARPQLVPPSQVAQRGARTLAGRSALLHALAHIEFNAINLALDVVWRFARLPEAFYRDWVRVAAEEALHFSLLQERLAKHDSAYGDFPAHDGLWEMAEKTKADLVARLALVPRTLEARGLDASPVVRAKLADAGDEDSALVIDTILRDEIGHVAIGNRWFRFACERAGLDPIAAHRASADKYGGPVLRGPINHAARRAAGFEERELHELFGAKPH
jgi:uncharacterized ferritin-like protein (DUF455 family)